MTCVERRAGRVGMRPLLAELGQESAQQLARCWRRCSKHSLAQLAVGNSVFCAVMALRLCSDDGVRVWPTPNPTLNEARRVVECERHGTVLCARTLDILNATCDELSQEAALADRLNAPLLSYDALTRIRTNGLFHRPTEVAALLIHLASETRSREVPLRFLTTNANNGWASVLAAAFLHRTHQGGFSGVAYNDLKWEWACDEPTRKLTRLAGLSWRHTKALNPAAEAALMSYHPQARSPLWQTAFSNATELLPVSWVGSPPPFDVCWRQGQLGESWVNRSGFAGLARDLAVLADWCRLFVFYGAPDALHSESVAAALPKGAARRLVQAATRVGGFTVLRGAHGHGHHVSTGGSDAFAYVNKTPPAPPEFYAAACIEDISGCLSHHHEERCGYPRGRDTLPLACLPSSPLPGCCEKK